MKIIGAASAFPTNYYSQEFLLSALSEYWAPQLQNLGMLRRLHEHVSVDGRYLAVPVEEYYRMRAFGEFNDAWMDAAEDLGSQALCRAMTQAGVDRGEIGALFFVSVTGISSPSIDARLINKLKLSPSTKRIPIFGLGCVAGGRDRARRGLCESLPGGGGRAGVCGALFVDAAERRPHGGQSDLFRIIWRRRGVRAGCRRRLRAVRTGDHRYPIHSLSRDGRRNGLERIGKGF